MRALFLRAVLAALACPSLAGAQAYDPLSAGAASGDPMGAPRMSNVGDAAAAEVRANQAAAAEALDRGRRGEVSPAGVTMGGDASSPAGPSLEAARRAVTEAQEARAKELQAQVQRSANGQVVVPSRNDVSRDCSPILDGLAEAEAGMQASMSVPGLDPDAVAQIRAARQDMREKIAASIAECERGASRPDRQRVTMTVQGLSPQQRQDAEFDQGVRNERDRLTAEVEKALAAATADPGDPQKQAAYKAAVAKRAAFEARNKTRLPSLGVSDEVRQAAEEFDALRKERDRLTGNVEQALAAAMADPEDREKQAAYRAAAAAREAYEQRNAGRLPDAGLSAQARQYGEEQAAIQGERGRLTAEVEKALAARTANPGDRTAQAAYDAAVAKRAEYEARQGSRLEGPALSENERRYGEENQAVRNERDRLTSQVEQALAASIADPSDPARKAAYEAAIAQRADYETRNKEKLPEVPTDTRREAEEYSARLKERARLTSEVERALAVSVADPSDPAKKAAHDQAAQRRAAFEEANTGKIPSQGVPDRTLREVEAYEAIRNEQARLTRQVESSLASALADPTNSDKQVAYAQAMAARREYEERNAARLGPRP